MEFSGPEAAEILDISPELFRKRLQLARSSLINFTKSYCGLVSDSAPCRCNRQVSNGLRGGKLSPHICNFAATRTSFEQTRAMIRQVEETRWAIQVHRSNHPRAASVDFARRLVETLDPERRPNLDS